MSMRKSTRTYLFALLLSLCCVPTQTCAQTYGVTDEAENQNTPQSWAAVELPRGINTENVRTVSLNKGTTQAAGKENTETIQAVLNAMPNDGGVVVIPSGTWLCGPLTIGSKTVFHLSANCTLKMLPLGQYPETKDGKLNYDYTYDDGNKHSFTFFLTNKNDATDIVIEGEDKTTSIIDGQGEDWWVLNDKGKAYKAIFDSLSRSSCIRVTSGSRYLIKNLTTRNTPNTNITLGRSGDGTNCTVHDVIIRNPSSTLKYSSSNAMGKGLNPSHNTDGIPVWSQHMNIYNCDISTGDDNIVMDSKAQYVHIWDCTFGAGHGASTGSYTQDVHDIIWENITFNATEAGFKIKSNYDVSNHRGGEVKNIIYRNCTMNNVTGDVVTLDCWYDKKYANSPSEATGYTYDSKETPYFHDILFQNITATGTKGAIWLYGRSEKYIENVTFDNVNISASTCDNAKRARVTAKGLTFIYCKGVKFVNGCKVVSSSDDIYSYGGDVDVKGNYTGTYAIDMGKEIKKLDTNGTHPSDKTVSPWDMGDGYSIANNKSKTFDDEGGGTAYIKYSKDTRYTITIPSNAYAVGFSVKGYNKGASTAATLVFDGKSYDFPAGDKVEETYNIPFSSVLNNGSFSFSVTGAQLALSISIYGETVSSGSATTVEKELKGTLSATVSSDKKTWTFDDGSTITNGNSNGKDYKTNGNYIEFARNEKYTITPPSGMKITNVTITGKCKYGSTIKEATGYPAILKELNGTNYKYDPNTGIYDESYPYTPFPLNDSGKDDAEIKLDLTSNPASSVSFTAGGSGQILAYFKITYSSSTSSSTETPNPTMTLPSIYLSDRATKYNQVAVNPADVTLLGRGFVSTTWNTICLPFDVPAADLETYFGEGTQLAVFNQTTDKKDAMYFDTTDGGIEAGIPYLIKPGRTNEATTEDIVFKSVNLTTTEASIVTNSVTGYKFVGTYVSTALPTDGTGMFMVSGNKLRVATSRNNVMRGYRCYVLAPSTSAAKATRFVVEDAEATGISNVPAQTVGKAGAWYTLSGQRIDRAHLGRGIYIHGGKKVIIR